MSETDKLKVEMYDDMVKEKNKEYIELACRFRGTCNDIKNKDKEIERINNNWNKLEKYLSDKVTMYGRLGDLSRMAECQIISQKVQELKGDDKNDKS